MEEINFIKKMFLFSALYFVSTGIQAQTNLEVAPEKLSNVNALPINTIPAKTGNINSVNATTTSEPIQTPEQQGFDKLEINGKHIYMKKVGDVIIEFKPE